VVASAPSRRKPHR